MSVCVCVVHVSDQRTMHNDRIGIEFKVGSKWSFWLTYCDFDVCEMSSPEAMRFGYTLGNVEQLNKL